MSTKNSLKAVFAALIGNFSITILKFIVAFFTKSSGMLAEAIHSTADCLNQVFLIIGDKQSKKEPDEMHPFGYGRVEYFYGFLVAVFLFFGGALFSIYEGIHKILHPEPLKHLYWSILIIGISTIIEGKTFLIALKEYKRLSKKPFIIGIKDISDTNILVILLEDFAALCGLVVVFIFTLLTLIFNNPIYDSISSILVGLILVYISFTLLSEIKKLMIGENIPREMRNNIKNIIKSHSNIVKHVNKIQAEMIGRNQFMLLLSIDFEDDVVGYELENYIEDMKMDIKKIYPNVTNMYIELKDSNKNNKI